MGFHKDKKPKKHKKSGICFKHNITAHPGVLQSIDDQGCYSWMRMKSFMWSGIVLSLIITVTFLPVRLLFYTYVSPNWLGNLGLLSLVASLVFLVVYYGRDKKGLIGKFSMAYRQRMSRFVHHKRSIPFFICFQLISISMYMGVFYASTEDIIVDETPEFNEFNMSLSYEMLPIDTQHENTVFDKMKNYDITGVNIDDNFSTEMAGGLMSVFLNDMHSTETKDEMYDYFKNSRHSDEKYILDDNDMAGIFNSLPKSVNSATDGWASHFNAVWLIGDIEYTALFFMYRRVYKKVDVGLPWKAVNAWKSRRGGFLYAEELIKENRAK